MAAFVLKPEFRHKGDLVAPRCLQYLPSGPEVFADLCPIGNPNCWMIPRVDLGPLKVHTKWGGKIGLLKKAVPVYLKSCDTKSSRNVYDFDLWVPT